MKTKMKRYLGASLFLGLILFSHQSYSQASPCQVTETIKDDYSANTLKVRLRTVCTFDALETDYQGLFDDYKDNVLEGEDTTKVHSTLEDAFDGLSGVLIDATLVTKDKNGTLTRRSTHKVAHDGASRVFSQEKTSKVSGTDNATYTRYIEVLKSLEKKGEATVFILESEAHVEKPWFAPKGIFTNAAKEGLKESFAKGLSEELDLILENSVILVKLED